VLSRDLETDILVVGAGVTGAIVADALAQSHDVIVIERRGLVEGATAASTALVTFEIDMPLTRLTRRIGREKAMRAWRRSMLAVTALAGRLRLTEIQADWEARDSLYLSGTLMNAGEMEEEWAARRTIGIETAILSGRQLNEQFGIRRSAAILSPGNYVADPRRLAVGFLLSACRNGVRVFTDVDAIALETHRGGVTVKTRRGPVIRAREVILCTGYELPEGVPTQGHSIVSTYAIATRPQPQRLWSRRCMIWEAASPYLYVRDSPDGRVICGGEDIDCADADARDDRISAKSAALARKLKALLPQLDTHVDFAWAGTFGASDTGLPSIGALPGMAHCWAALGFGGNGITYARIAADIIAAALDGRSDPDADIYAFASPKGARRSRPR
jgi:glycine/D-amino acid oxidase-like deaminating enzyme